MGSIAIRTISKRFLHGNLMRQTCIRNTESLSPRHHSRQNKSLLHSLQTIPFTPIFNITIRTILFEF
ncbi:hypothetical protein Peur_023043 [Populus x canadensis]